MRTRRAAVVTTEPAGGTLDLVAPTFVYYRAMNAIGYVGATHRNMIWNGVVSCLIAAALFKKLT